MPPKGVATKNASVFELRSFSVEKGKKMKCLAVQQTLAGLLIGAWMALATATVSAQSVDKATQERLTKALESGNQGLSVATIRAAAMPGMYEGDDYDLAFDLVEVV